MTKSSVDKLGDSLRTGLTDENLQKLDEYRRSFFPFYSEVVETLREVLKVEISGRPAKTTISIYEKLYRSPMRLSQMADIAGCRIIVPDMIVQAESVDLFGSKVKYGGGGKAIKDILEDFSYRVYEHDKMILAKLKGSSSGDYKLVELLDKDFIFEMKEELKDEIRRMMSAIDDIKGKL